jgi:hypothetical protein
MLPNTPAIQDQITYLSQQIENLNTRDNFKLTQHTYESLVSYRNSLQALQQEIDATQEKINLNAIQQLFTSHLCSLINQHATCLESLFFDLNHAVFQKEGYFGVALLEKLIDSLKWHNQHIELYTESKEFNVNDKAVSAKTDEIYKRFELIQMRFNSLVSQSVENWAKHLEKTDNTEQTADGKVAIQAEIKQFEHYRDAYAALCENQDSFLRSTQRSRGDLVIQTIDKKLQSIQNLALDKKPYWNFYTSNYTLWEKIPFFKPVVNSASEQTMRINRTQLK